MALDVFLDLLPVEVQLRVLVLQQQLKVDAVAAAQDLERLGLRVNGEENPLLQIGISRLALAMNDGELAAAGTQIGHGVTPC
jgi:hypothetical protein